MKLFNTFSETFWAIVIVCIIGIYWTFIPLNPVFKICVNMFILGYCVNDIRRTLKVKKEILENERLINEIDELMKDKDKNALELYDKIYILKGRDSVIREMIYL